MVPEGEVAVINFFNSRVGDIFGRKKVFMAGVFLFSLASVACAISPTGNMLIAARFVQGIAGAMLFGVSMAIVTSVFPANERGKALGINTAVIYFSIAAGSFLGGLLTHYWGWHSIFAVTGCLGLLALTGIFTVLKGEWDDAKGERYDWKGTLIYAIGLSAIIYGCSVLPSILGFSLIAAGVTSFAVFVYYEKRQSAPVFNEHVSGEQGFSHVVICNAHQLCRNICHRIHVEFLFTVH